MQTETCGREELENKIEATNGSDCHEVIIEISPESRKVQDQLQLPKEEDADIHDPKIEGKPLIVNHCFTDINRSKIF